MEEKLRECFEDMVVYKDLNSNSAVAGLGLPSFLRDWILKKFQDEDGTLDTREMTEFVRTYKPNADEWVAIKNRVVNEYERVKLLTRIQVDIDIAKQESSFALPDYSLPAKDTIIEPYVWEECKAELVNARETWGVVELGYRPPEGKVPGKIKLASFTSFQPYEVELDFYKDMRREFSTEEWISVLLGAIDYNAAGFSERHEQITTLSRLLPFVEQRVNLLELAPKGTGKSYLFGNISKNGLLTDGGRVTRAKMFYDVGSRRDGFVVGKDYVAIDEVKLVTFGDTSEMRSILQGYMERGRYNVSGHEGESSAGIVFLGNIAQERMDVYDDMLVELPALFRESALIDRVHGFIKGWDIPRFSDRLKVHGWALNTEYFCTILHMMRNDFTYRGIVDELVDVPLDAYVRHTEAVKRLATGFLKLFFPHVRDAGDVDPREFRRYCLRPAVDMRTSIWRQLSIMDEEYKDPGKQMPSFSVHGTS